MSRARNASRVRDFIVKHVGELERRLRYAPLSCAVVAGALAAIFAPRVDKDHPPQQTFFVVALGVLGAIAATLFLAQPEGGAKRRALRFLRRSTPLYFLVGAIAALSGVITSLPSWTYRWLFALTVGPGLAVLVVFVLVGQAVTGGQIADTTRELEQKYSEPERTPEPRTKTPPPGAG